ncbi:hypothetical protein SteCoe_37065 [Stentor coeruleus]|uniref:RING-type domain-containing protein n=1 Tax=Stentor coeruleus TaxID=5963 RepID=A0A1R2ANU5_9CILI|nr:hypothetical protein SteCoe_37065 [Stentor coeruleus]
MHCSEYFLQSNAYCYFCRKPRKKYDNIKCGHIICTYCLFFIKENNSIGYIKNISCCFCKDFLCNSYEIDKSLLNIDNNPIVLPINEGKHNSLVELNICCKRCTNIINFKSYCSRHILCRKCVLEFSCWSTSESCKVCIQINEHFCKKCFTIIDDPNCKIRNIKCSYKHFYCSPCFEETFHNNNIICFSCLKLFEPIKDKICIFCKDEFKKCHIKLCSEHSICKICSDTFSAYEFEIYIKVFGCEKCVENFSNREKYKISQTTNFNQDSVEIYTQNPKKSNRIASDTSFTLPNEKHKKGNLGSNTQNLKNKNSSHSTENFEEIKTKPQAEVPKNINDKLCSEISLQNKKNQMEVSLNKNEATVANIIYNVPESIKTLPKKSASTSQIRNQSESKFHSEDKQQGSYKNQELCLENLHRLNEKVDKNLVSCCGMQVSRMECGHPLCKKCIEKAFEEKFNYFITLTAERNYNLLNSISWGIGCYKNECYLKICFPFGFVEHIASKIVRTNNYPEKLIHHFGLLFEGIKYNFHGCEKCGFVTGDKIGAACMWCN